jgi:hypothetical protein
MTLPGRRVEVIRAWTTTTRIIAAILAWRRRT